MSILLRIPDLHLISEGNAREHWTTRRNRRFLHEAELRSQLLSYRTASAMMAMKAKGPPYSVKWTRVGKKLLDPDAVGSSFKFVQDELCRHLGVDDGDIEKIGFEYTQRKGKDYAVEVEIKRKEA